MGVWRTYDPVVTRILAWEMGSRGDACCNKLLDKVEIQNHDFLMIGLGLFV